MRSVTKTRFLADLYRVRADLEFIGHGLSSDAERDQLIQGVLEEIAEIIAGPELDSARNWRRDVAYVRLQQTVEVLRGTP